MGRTALIFNHRGANLATTHCFFDHNHGGHGMSGSVKGWLAAFAVMLALGWWVLDGSTTRPRVVRSRLTLVVETPEGERTGSSVTQVTTYFPGGLTRAQGWGLTYQLVGEAVVVDLAQRGCCFRLSNDRRSSLMGAETLTMQT